MELPHWSPRTPVIPDFAPDSECHKGFEGMDEKERARRAEILHRAYSIWERKGAHHDTHLDDWLEAEKEVSKET